MTTEENKAIFELKKSIGDIFAVTPFIEAMISQFQESLAAEMIS
jgi:hypothetical protein